MRLTLPPEEVDRVERDEPQLVLKTLGEVLLTPTRIYTLDVLELRERLRQQDSDLHGLAHITGGGLRANVPRALPESLTARVHPDAWRTPSVFRVVAELAEMDGAELRATLNAGIGMVAVLPRDDEQLARELLDLRGLRSWTIGDVIPRSNVGERYEEAGR